LTGAYQLTAQLQTELAQVDRGPATLATKGAENEERRSQIMTAPADGSLTLLALTAGQPVQPAQHLASIAPAGAPLQAHLFAPSRTVGFAAAGQEVQLRDAAFLFLTCNLPLIELPGCRSRRRERLPARLIGNTILDQTALFERTRCALLCMIAPN
jgi:hypothetical protein